MFENSGNFESKSSIVNSIEGLHGKELLEKGMEALGLPSDLIGSDIQNVIASRAKDLARGAIKDNSSLSQYSEYLDVIDKNGGDWRGLVNQGKQYLVSKVLLPKAEILLSKYQSKLKKLSWLLPVKLPKV